MRLTTLMLLAANLLAQASPVDLASPRIVAGSLSGTVTTPDGRAVVRALILVRLQPGTGVNVPDFTVHAIANQQGEFAFTTLPVGKYTLCPQAPDEDVVSPCDWVRQPLEVEIFNGRAATSKLVMAKGLRVTIQVSDTGQVLASNANRARPPSITVGVTTPHGFLPARPKNRAAVRLDYEVVVPFATPSDALIMGEGVDMEDEAGKKAVNRTLHIPLRLKVGDPPKSANARITGLSAN